MKIYTNKHANIDGHDECINRLQQNQSDVILSLSNYPISMENITQGLIIGDSAINFLSFYYKEKSSVTEQVTESFKSFSPFFWSLIGMSLFVIWCLLKIKLIMKKKFICQFFQASYSFKRLKPKVRMRKHRNLMKKLSFHNKTNLAFNLMAHFMRVGEINSRTLLNRILFLQLSFMSLIIIHIFMTLTKTELVVIPDPEIYWSLKDIMQAGALPLFYFGFKHEQYLLDSPQGSIGS